MVIGVGDRRAISPPPLCHCGLEGLLLLCWRGLCAFCQAGQLALGTPWASAFSRAPGELVGRTHYCLACDGGRLPRPWAEGREVSGRKPEEDKMDSDREVNSG